MVVMSLIYTHNCRILTNDSLRIIAHSTIRYSSIRVGASVNPCYRGLTLNDGDPGHTSACLEDHMQRLPRHDLGPFLRGRDGLYSNPATPIPERVVVVLGDECVDHAAPSSVLKVWGWG